MNIPDNLPPNINLRKQELSSKLEEKSTHLAEQIQKIEVAALHFDQIPKGESLKKGHVIVLTGIVASGKSSIVKALQSINPDFHEEDLDLRRDPEVETTRKMEDDMIDDTIKRSLEGKPTIISLFKASHFARRLFEKGIIGIPVTTVLAHCPFSEIPSRLDARNSAAEAPEGNAKNYRDPLVPIDQFAELYKHDFRGIERIDRATATEYFNSSFDKMVAHGKRKGTLRLPDEQIKKDKAEFCEKFLKELGFIDELQRDVNVGPRTEYDLIVDTSKYRDAASREELMRKMLRYIDE